MEINAPNDPYDLTHAQEENFKQYNVLSTRPSVSIGHSRVSIFCDVDIRRLLHFAKANPRPSAMDGM
jgi:hypothetical protein